MGIASRRRRPADAVISMLEMRLMSLRFFKGLPGG
jgi:hypothetical protein